MRVKSRGDGQVKPASCQYSNKGISDSSSIIIGTGEGNDSWTRAIARGCDARPAVEG